MALEEYCSRDTRRGVNSPHASPPPATSQITRPAELETYSVEEVAEILHLSRPTVYRLLLRRILRALPGLRTKRITGASLRAYIASASR